MITHLKDRLSTELAEVPEALDETDGEQPAGERPTGAMRVRNGDRLRLVLLAGVGMFAVLLVLLRLKGGGAAPPTPAVGAPVNQAVAANGSVFAEDLVLQLTTCPGVTRVVGSYVPGVGAVVSLEATDIEIDKVRLWLSDALVPMVPKVPAGLEADRAAFLFDVTGKETFLRTILVPVIALEDPAGYTLSSAVKRLGDPAAQSATATALAASTPPSSQSPQALVPAPVSDSAVGAEVSTSLVATTIASSPAAAPALGSMDKFDQASTAWTPLSGQWKFVEGTYQQLDNSGYDFITQFATPQPSSFEVSAKLRATEGDLNAGFLLFQPKKGTRNDSVLVDLTDKAGYVRWGHYDKGGVYVFDGGNKLATPINSATGAILKVTFKDGTVRVYLDDKQVGEFTTTSTTGSVGIVTSVSKIAVDDFLLADSSTGA